MSEFENPRSIIPTKGEKVELEKLEGFDLKYTSGRRFCGIYTPTMSTAFDPKSAEDLYQARMRMKYNGCLQKTLIILSSTGCFA